MARTYRQSKIPMSSAHTQFLQVNVTNKKCIFVGPKTPSKKKILDKQ